MLVRRLPSFHPWSSSFDGLEDVRREMSRMLDAWNERSSSGPAGVFPPIDVTETENAIIVRAEVPGIKASDLAVRVENQTLTLSGERKAPAEFEKASMHRREREWGQFRRSFNLPFRVDSAHVDARCTHGILTIELPKAAEARAKQITVQAGS
jgi:HSP20 family protein